MTRALLILCLSLGLHAAELKLGVPLALKEKTPIKKLLSTPDAYVGKKVQVEGKITEVCQAMGCWMMLTDGAGSMVRIKVTDGEIMFPKDSSGRKAIAEGEFAKFELTREQAVQAAKHEAEEMGRPFDPASVKGPVAIYQIQGTGAVLVDETNNAR
jgi:hypothetical protein